MNHRFKQLGVLIASAVFVAGPLVSFLRNLVSFWLGTLAHPPSLVYASAILKDGVATGIYLAVILLLTQRLSRWVSLGLTVAIERAIALTIALLSHQLTGAPLFWVGQFVLSLVTLLGAWGVRYCVDYFCPTDSSDEEVFHVYAK